jgi:hypothetical protein
MFHHSLEHMPGHQAVLQAARDRLAGGGVVLVRMPLVSSDAFERYREHWVQIDAPRHLLLHTERGFRDLARSAGLDVADIVYDSEAFQFWGSELYRRGLALDAWRERPGELFGDAELAAFQAEAEAVNARGRGDQAAFFLQREGEGRAMEREDLEPDEATT